ncbi:MAG TPA: hypothetical protein VID27_06790, partial [Blastocatellia bacterium]
LCWSVILVTEPTPTSIAVYTGLSIFSCLFVTKDEWMHAKFCRAGEHWLHAMLFILHPLSFLSAGLMWGAINSTRTNSQPFGWIRYEGFERTFLIVNATLTLFFGLYQLIYWNMIWKNTSKAQ